MALIKIVLDIDDLVRRYQAGETEQNLAKVLGVSRTAIRDRLLSAGVRRRGNTEARLLMWKGIPNPLARDEILSAAHSAVRGKGQTQEHRCRIAQTKETRESGVSRMERVLACWLSEAGFVPSLQKAIGPFNIDVAIEKFRVAVELFGGNWHNHGRHAARFRHRCEYLLDRGWLPVIVWVTRDYPLERSAVDQIVALMKGRGKPESGRGHEVVMRGDGYVCSPGGFNPNNGAIVSSPESC